MPVKTRKQKWADVGTVVKPTANVGTFDLVPAGAATGLKGARVFDVGQGDAVGILNEKDEVIAYFDYGGLADHPDRGNFANVSKRLPVKTAGGVSATIILSHWDKDHYYSATKSPQTHSLTWLVPRQPVGPQAALFAASLTNASCWPASIKGRPVEFPIGSAHIIKVEKCGPSFVRGNNEDRNLTGLAVTLQEQDYYKQRLRRLYLPGDAPFHAVPTMVHGGYANSNILTGFIAYHHGSDSHWSSATDAVIGKPDPNASMVYSYAKNNSYGHPVRTKYQLSGWDKKAVTTPDLRAQNRTFTDILL